MHQILPIPATDHPLYPDALQLLLDTFGPSGEIESAASVADFVSADPFAPVHGDTRSAFQLFAAVADHAVVGARAACIIVHPELDLYLIYLAYIVVVPEFRGGALTHDLRFAPVAAGHAYLAQLIARGDIPARAYTPWVVLEMECFDGDPAQARRVLSYGRAGFSALVHPYFHPGLPEGDGVGAPIPMMLVVQHPGPTLPPETVAKLLRLLADDYHTATTPEAVAAAFQPAFDALTHPIALLPLPTQRDDLPAFAAVFAGVFAAVSTANPSAQ